MHGRISLELDRFVPEPVEILGRWKCKDVKAGKYCTLAFAEHRSVLIWGIIPSQDSQGKDVDYIYPITKVKGI